MQQLTFTLQDPRGLHVVPTGALCSLCCRYQCAVTAQYERTQVNAKDIRELITLAVHAGDSVTLIFEGHDEEEACAAVKTLVSTF